MVDVRKVANHFNLYIMTKPDWRERCMIALCIIAFVYIVSDQMLQRQREADARERDVYVISEYVAKLNWAYVREGEK